MHRHTRAVNGVVIALAMIEAVVDTVNPSTVFALAPSGCDADGEVVERRVHHTGEQAAEDDQPGGSATSGP